MFLRGTNGGIVHNRGFSPGLNFHSRAAALSTVQSTERVKILPQNFCPESRLGRGAQGILFSEIMSAFAKKNREFYHYFPKIMVKSLFFANGFYHYFPKIMVNRKPKKGRLIFSAKNADFTIIFDFSRN